MATATETTTLNYDALDDALFAPPPGAPTTTLSFDNLDQALFDIVPPRPKEGFFGTITGTFHRTVMKEVPLMYGKFMEVVGTLASAQNPSAPVGGQIIADLGRKTQENASKLFPDAPPPPEFKEGDYLNWAASLISSGLATTLPSLAFGGGAGLAAKKLGTEAIKRLSTRIGQSAAIMSSAPLNVGEAALQFEQEGIDKEAAAMWSMVIGVPITALDVWGLEKIGIFGNRGKEIRQNIVKHIAQEVKRGATIESLTEGSQSALREGLAYALTGNPDLEKRIWRTFEEMVAGGGVGGLVSGVGSPLSYQKGEIEKAGDRAAPITSEDEASPAPTDMIKMGERIRAELLEGLQKVNPALKEMALPPVKTPAIWKQGDQVQKVRIEDFLPGDETASPMIKVWLEAEGVTQPVPLPLVEGESIVSQEQWEAEQRQGQEIEKTLDEVVKDEEQAQKEQQAQEDTVDQVASDTIVQETETKAFSDEVSKLIDQMEEVALDATSEISAELHEIGAAEVKDVAPDKRKGLIRRLQDIVKEKQVDDKKSETERQQGEKKVTQDKAQEADLSRFKDEVMGVVNAAHVGGAVDLMPQVKKELEREGYKNLNELPAERRKPLIKALRDYTKQEFKRATEELEAKETGKAKPETQPTKPETQPPDPDAKPTKPETQPAKPETFDEDTGAPIEQYKPRRRKLPLKKNRKITTAQVDGENWWTNDHLAVRGELPTLPAGVETKDDLGHFAELIHNITVDAKSLKDLHPIGYAKNKGKVIGQKKANTELIFFDHIPNAVDSRYYEEVRRRFGNDLEWKVSDYSGQRPVWAFKDGKPVATIMSISLGQTKYPGIDKVRRAAKKKTAPAKRGPAEKPATQPLNLEETRSGRFLFGGGKTPGHLVYRMTGGAPLTDEMVRNIQHTGPGLFLRSNQIETAVFETEAEAQAAAKELGYEVKTYPYNVEKYNEEIHGLVRRIENPDDGVTILEEELEKIGQKKIREIPARQRGEFHARVRDRVKEHLKEGDEKNIIKSKPTTSKEQSGGEAKADDKQSGNHPGRSGRLSGEARPGGLPETLEGAPTPPGEVSPEERSPAGSPRSSDREPGEDVLVDGEKESGKPGGAPRGPVAVHPPAERKPDAGTGTRPGALRPTRPPRPKTARGVNFRITDAARVGVRSTEKQIYEDNVRAIRLLKELQKEERMATPEEQTVLVQHRGWGGLKNVFSPTYNDKANSARHDELKKLLTPDEWADAFQSILNAHYTSPEVIDAMWEVASHLGFEGGKVLEPAAGIGHFIGRRPDTVDASFTAVEIDAVSAAITKQLYQQEAVQHTGYEDAKLPESFYDLVISNVPFSSQNIPVDDRYNKRKLALHDFYLYKSLHMVRPGGLVMAISTRGTLDKKETRARKAIASVGDLVASFRLPQTAFVDNARTTVTTDILVFRRKIEGQPLGNTPAWMEIVEVTLSVPADSSFDPQGEINEYYKGRRHMILGKLIKRRGRYGNDQEMAVEAHPDAGTVTEQMEAAVEKEKIPQDLYVPPEQDAEEIRTESIQVEDEELAGIQDGAFTIRDGKIYQRLGDQLDSFNERTPAQRRDGKKIRGLVKLNEVLKDLFERQLRPKGEKAAITRARKELNTLYDAMVKEYGYLTPLLEDFRPYKAPNPDAHRLMALELWDEDKRTAEKVTLFKKNTLAPPKAFQKPANPQDALVQSLNRTGKIDLAWMAKQLGIGQDQVTDRLKGVIFKIPGAHWVTAEEYLSGNVREKLEFAESAAGTDPLYASNVEALRDAIPKDIEPHDIDTKMGDTWLPPRFVEEFIGTLMDTPAKNVKVEFVPQTGKYVITYATPTAAWNAQNSVVARSTWGTARRSFHELVNNLVNGGFPKVTTNKKFDATATTLARAKMDEIAEKFNEWIWSDATRAKELAKIYNRERNSIKLRQYDGSHLTFPGMSEEFKQKGGLRKHQVNAVWRALVDPASYFGHEVGTGKTMILIAAAMEARRLGIARRPLLSVPNDKVLDFATEFRELYPAANILVANVPGGSSAKNRMQKKRVMAQIAYNDWDAVIMNHESFNVLGISNAYMAKVVREEIEMIVEALKAAHEQGDDPRRGVARDLANKQVELKNKLKWLLKKVKRSDVMTFEETGVDMTLVDEAHVYKNLYYASSFGREIRGLKSEETGRSTEYYGKTKYLHEIGGRIIMASGTPISNSIGELFTLSRYLQPKTLADMKLEFFDNWANSFGVIKEAVEYAPEGGRYRKVTKFAEFHNMTELMQMVYSVLDAVTADKVGIKRPKLWKGKPQIVVLKKNEFQEAYQQIINHRAEAIRANPVEARPDNMLVVSNDGRNAAVDMRMIGPQYPEMPNGKIDVGSQKVKEIYDATNHFKGTQVIFLDRVRATQGNPNFAPHQAIREKLIELGIPEDEIVSTGSIQGDEKKMKKQFKSLYKRVNSGEVRVLIASTKKGGTGVNFQRLVSAMHHLDVDYNMANYEQRNGRGLRQGNEAWSKHGWELRIYNYSTEATVDAFMWDKVQYKAGLFKQILSGVITARRMGDIAPEVASAQEMVAITSGDPLIKEKHVLDQRKIHLDLLHRGFMGERYQAIAQKDRYQNTVRRLKSELEPNRELEEASQNARKIVMPDGKELTFEGWEGVADPTQEAWREHVMSLIDQNKETLEKGRTLGMTKGLEAATLISDGGKLKIPIELVTQWNDQLEFRSHLDFNGVQTGNPYSKLGNLIRNIGESATITLGRHQKSIETLEGKEIPALEKVLNKTFKQAGEIKQVQARIDAIQRSWDAQDSKSADQFEEEHGDESEEMDMEKVDDDAPPPPRRMALGRPLPGHRLPENFSEQLQDLVERIAPGAELELEPNAIEGGYGYTIGRMITASLAEAPHLVVNHEIVHYLRNANVITNEEWATLKKAADKYGWFDNYQVKQRYPDFYLQGKPGEAAYEEAIAEAYADFATGSSTVVLEPAPRTVFEKLRKLFRQFGNFLRQAFGKKDLRPLEVFRAIERGEIGGRVRMQDGRPVLPALHRKMFRKPRKEEPGFEFTREEEEQAWERGKADAEDRSFVDRLKTGIHDFGQLWVRTHKHLPRTPRYAEFTESLRVLTASYNRSIEQVADHLQKVTRGMTPRELDIFSRLVYLSNLMDDVRKELTELPIFGNPEHFLDNYRKFMEWLAERPELERKMMNRLAIRNKFVQGISRQMYEAGIIGKEALLRRNYITHRVMDYWAAKSKGPNRIKGISDPRRAVRFGTTKDINTDYLTVEAHWIMGAIRDLAQKDVINYLEKSEHNMKAALRTAIRTRNAELRQAALGAEAKQVFGKALTEQGIQEAMRDLSPGHKQDAMASMPIYTKLASYRLRIAINFKILRNNLIQPDIPKDLWPEFNALQEGEGSEISVRPLLVWVSQNLDDVSGESASKILYAGIDREHWLRKNIQGWVTNQNDAQAMYQLGWEGIKVFQPSKGRFLIRAQTVTQKAMDKMSQRFQEIATDPALGGVFPLDEVHDFLNTIRPQLIVGGLKYQMPLPAPIVDTLENYGYDDLETEAEKLYAEGLRKWKLWTLLNPRRIWKYTTGNISGDLVKVIGTWPSALRQIPRAANELIGTMYLHKSPNQTYAMGRRHGVHDSGWGSAEVTEATRRQIKRMIRESSDHPIRTLGRRIINEVKRFNTFRENLLRYALYIHLREKAIPQAKLRARDRLGTKEVEPWEYMPAAGYGGGNWRYANALKSDDARAAYLARETLGDYADTSIATKYLRKYWMPFFAWQEINSKYFFRVIFSTLPAVARGFKYPDIKYKRIAQVGAGVGTRVALWTTFKVLAFLMLKEGWNQLFHEDEREELSEEDQLRMSPIIGRTGDGQILLLRAPGALPDFAQWLGYEDVAMAMMAVMSGRGSWKDVMRALVGGPIDKSWNGVTPAIKIPYEVATGTTTFPSFLKPRTAMDRWKTIFQAFSADVLYDKAVGRPTRGWGDYFVSWFLDKRDLEINAYFKVKGWGYDFEREKGDAGGRSAVDRKTQTYYFYRLALLRDDRSLAAGYRNQLKEMGVTFEQMRSMLRRAHPVGMLSNAHKAEFVAMLTLKEKRSYDRAVAFYKRAFLRSGTSQ